MKLFASPPRVRGFVILWRGIVVLTPKDIEKKVFSSGIKGYKKSEVDDFLDEIMLDMESLINENEKRKSMLADMKKELAESREKADSMFKTLERARLLMSDISESAEKRAEIIIKNANEEAGKLIEEAKETANALTEEHSELKSSVAEFKRKYKNILMEELERLESKTEDWFNDLKEDFYPASMVGVPETDTTEPVDPAVAAGLFSEPEASAVKADEKKGNEEKASGSDTPDISQVSDTPNVEDVTDIAPDGKSEGEEETKASDAGRDAVGDIKMDENHRAEDRHTLTDIVLPKSSTRGSAMDDMATTVVITQEEMNRIPGSSPEDEKK